MNAVNGRGAENRQKTATGEKPVAAQRVKKTKPAVNNVGALSERPKCDEYYRKNDLEIRCFFDTSQTNRADFNGRSMIAPTNPIGI